MTTSTMPGSLRTRVVVSIDSGTMATTKAAARPAPDPKSRRPTSPVIMTMAAPTPTLASRADRTNSSTGNWLPGPRPARRSGLAGSRRTSLRRTARRPRPDSARPSRGEARRSRSSAGRCRQPVLVDVDRHVTDVAVQAGSRTASASMTTRPSPIANALTCSRRAIPPACGSTTPAARRSAPRARLPVAPRSATTPGRHRPAAGRALSRSRRSERRETAVVSFGAVH